MKLSNTWTACFFSLLFLLNTSIKAADSIANVKYLATLNGNMACIASCGNCCTGQMGSDLNGSFTLTIGSSDVDLQSFYEDQKSHWVSGYYYQSKGSCGMGQCNFFHVTAIDKELKSTHNDTTQVLDIPQVSAYGKTYQVSLQEPYQILQATQIAGQSEDCSQGQQCAEGLSCVAYSSIAGKELKSCEISCIDKQYCPYGKSCINIADGPQNICQ
jgi:hypothetical protein